MGSASADNFAVQIVLLLPENFGVVTVFIDGQGLFHAHGDGGFGDIKCQFTGKLALSAAISGAVSFANALADKLMAKMANVVVIMVLNMIHSFLYVYIATILHFIE